MLNVEAYDADKRKNSMVMDSLAELPAAELLSVGVVSDPRPTHEKEECLEDLVLLKERWWESQPLPIYIDAAERWGLNAASTWEPQSKSFIDVKVSCHRGPT